MSGPSIDVCPSLREGECDELPPPPKRLLFRSDGVADDMTFGPDVGPNDGVAAGGAALRSLVISYDSDFEQASQASKASKASTSKHDSNARLRLAVSLAYFKQGSDFVRLLLDVEALVALARAPLSATEAYANDESVDSLIKSNRIYIGVAACLLVLQCLLVVLGRHLYAKRKAPTAAAQGSVTVPPMSNMGLRRYVLFSACANSFLLGGVVFGYSSAVLMFRQAEAPCALCVHCVCTAYALHTAAHRDRLHVSCRRVCSARVAHVASTASYKR